jgi:threonine dehydrogenase-like Zn-dependent dehydrogenase
LEKPQKTKQEPILVKISYAGICGSDVQRSYFGGAYAYPLVMGHEFSGTIEECPSELRFSKGDQVVIYPLIPCMRCPSCEIGEYAQCQSYDYYGSRRDGGFSEYITVGESNLFAIPSGVSLRSAAMVEPCAVAYHGVNQLSISSGSSGLVIGAGPIGNMCAQWMRTRGVDPVFIADIDEKKLEIAASMGLEAINSKTTDVYERITLKTGRSVDYVLEACGECSAPFGQIVLLGNLVGTLKLTEKQYSSILRKELTLKGTWNSKATPKGMSDWDRVLAAMDTKIIVAPLISHELSLSEGPEIFKKIFDKNFWFNKIIFHI